MACSASVPALHCPPSSNTPSPTLYTFTPLPLLQQQLQHAVSLCKTSPRRQRCVTRAGARGTARPHTRGPFRQGSVGRGQKTSPGDEWAAAATAAAAAASGQSGRGTAVLAAGSHVRCHVRCHAQAQEDGSSAAVPSSLVLLGLGSSEEEGSSALVSAASAAAASAAAATAATTAAAIAILSATAAAAAAAATVEGPEELAPVDDYSNFGSSWGGSATPAATSAATAAPEEEEVTPFQTAASVVLTGALTLLLIRTFRRRAAKAKETRMRSSVVDRLTPLSEVEKAKAALKAVSAEEPSSPPPTAFGAFSGAVMAGAITYVAYSFTIGVDENFAQQSISANYTIRSITITIRTIISGLGWLATGVFGANTLGLTLLAFQIALGLTPAERASAAAEESSAAAAAAEANKIGGALESKPLPEESKERSQ